MLWQCKHCGAINDVTTSKGEEVESLLSPGTFKSVCETCGEVSAVTQLNIAPTKPSALLDIVAAALAKQPSATRLISEDNTVAVHDTPRIWGKPFGKVGTTVRVDEATGGLVEAMASVLGRGQSVIDIVSLDAPGADDVFERMIFQSLKAAAYDTDGAVVIRILLGFVPVEGRFNEWCGRLLKAIKGWGGAPVPKLFIGQLYSIKHTQWNHCKIMASDGVRAIVGGHNLWWSAYATLPMAHDISLHVVGKAAYDAQVFCEYLWNWGGWWLNAWTLKPGKCSATDWVRVKTLDNEKPVQIFRCFPCREDKSVSSDAVPAPKIKIKVLTQPVDLGHKGLLLTETPNPFTARILGLGRCGQSHLVSTASDIAKQTIIENAKLSLKLCQQDLVFLGSGLAFPFKKQDHAICIAIAKALLTNEDLTVKIVVSPQRAFGGGAQYSWTSGAKGTMKLLQEFLKGFAGNKQHYKGACARLKVAPFCFTTCEFDSEDASAVSEDKLYRWPTLGKVGKPYPIGAACYPSPANHAKCFFADDEVCYVGSDNLYPNSNAEFGYLVEGRAVQALLEDYWDQVWTYSAPHCILPADDWD
jgi:murine toxin